MGFGVFRRRPDYESRARRVVFTVGVAAALPTLLLRPHAPPRSPEKPRFEYYQRQRLLPTVATAAVPAGQTLRPKHQFHYASFVRPWDYRQFSARKLVKPRLPGTAIAVGSEVPSRGIYTGPRGLYHTESAEGQPYASANTENAQIIPTGVKTRLNIATKSSFAAFSGVDADAWGMVDTSEHHVIVKHDGWYLVTFQVQSFNPTTGTEVTCQLDKYQTDGTFDRTFIKDTRVATGGTVFFNGSATIPFGAGQYIEAFVTHGSGVDKTIGVCYIGMHRFSGPTLVLPT